MTATSDLDIIEANEAFLDLVDVATINQIRSESLGRFVGRHGVDMNVLTSRSAGQRLHSALRYRLCAANMAPCAMSN